ncbi:MAG: hypothetical protein RLZZ127_957 [Planctomycetota bacterium]|jgi:hypothetical protein
MAPASCLDRWLADRPGAGWLAEACARAGDATALALAWGAAARRCGRDALAAPAAEAAAVRPGWDPARWSVDQAARVRLLLAVPVERLPAELDRLAGASTVEELTALYLALPLLPGPERFRARAAEGVRSNMLPVFQAVALDNPYPVEQLDDEAWSQMVLKAFFTGSDIDRVAGLGQRVPERLRRMLADYARERAAARRPVDERLFRYAPRP